MIRAYGQWLLRWRWPVIFVSFLVVSAAAWGLRDAQFTSDFRVFFGPDNPELRAFETLEATFTKTDNFLFVIRPKSGEVFTRRILGAPAWRRLY